MYCGTWHHSREREIQRSRFIRCHPSWIYSSSFHAKTTANQSHSHIALHRAFQVAFVSSSHASSCTLKLARVACVVLPHPVSPWINLVAEQEATRETQLLSSGVQPTGACVSCKSLQVHASGATNTIWLSLISCVISSYHHTDMVARKQHATVTHIVLHQYSKRSCEFVLFFYFNSEKSCGILSTICSAPR